MKKKLCKLLSFVVIAITSITGTAVAETPEEKGFAIAARSDRSDRGFGDNVATLNMVLNDGQGLTSKRELRIKTLEIPDESVGDKSIVIFDSPADVSGTALLSHAHITDPDDQWLYLPALKKIKRISSVNKSGPFVSSEFAFEDFTSQELNKYTYKYLREEPCPNIENMTCDVVERFPAYEHSGYTRQIGWYDQTEYQLRKVDFYDRKNELMKTLDFLNYKQYEGKYWRVLKMVMTNHIKGKSTELHYSDYIFNQGLTDNDFEKGVLKRAQ